MKTYSCWPPGQHNENCSLAKGRANILHLNILFSIVDGRKGHSGEIGNAPNLTGKKTKLMLGMCSTHFYLWFEFLMLKKDVGKLKKFFCTFSPPNFGVPVSRGDKDIFEIFSIHKAIISGFLALFKLTNLYWLPGILIKLFFRVTVLKNVQQT